MNPHARRHATRHQLTLDKPPRLEPAHPCLVCLGHGGWHVLSDDDGNPLEPPGEWVECWACDPDEDNNEQRRPDGPERRR